MTSTTPPLSEIAGLSARVAGAGRPILMLHGVGLRAEAWAAQITALSHGFRVIAPNMAGHGETPPPEGEMTLDDYIDAAQAVLDTLAEPALVVGHSMGAMIAVELAGRSPGKVRAVAALNAVFERTAEAAAAVQARAAALDGQTLPDPEPTLHRWFGQTPSPERTACAGWLRTVHPLGYKRAYRAFAQSDRPSRATLTALSCPALFATGALEPNSTPAMSRSMADLAPDGRAMIIDGAAHMMPMTHAPQVTAALETLAQEVWP